MKLCVVFLCLMGLTASAVARDDRKDAPNAWNRPIDKDHYEFSYAELRKTSGEMQRRELKPWSDSYWPYYKAGLANRYQTGAAFTNINDQIASLPSSESRLWSPAEKFDILRQLREGTVTFPLTEYFWGRHDYYHERYLDRPDDWRWMGICSGWAPASLNEVAPRHAVIVPLTDIPLVFYPGDLRALLSAAYDINTRNGSYRSVGLRCNLKPQDVIRDDTGRPVDGFDAAADRSFRILRDQRVGQAWFEARVLPDGPTVFYLHSERKKGFVPKASYQQFATFEALKDALDDEVTEPQPGHELAFFHNCRDLNPAALVASLHQQFKDPANVNLIAEMSAAHQVWNFPLWGYQLTLGAPKLVASLSPGQRLKYSPQTMYVADARIVLDYASAVQPNATHRDLAGNTEADFDYSRRVGYDVELEFNASGQLQGGEWLSHDSDSAIDFIWSYRGTVDDVASDGSTIIPYSLAAALRDCSLREPNAVVAIGSDGEQMPAVECLP